MSERLAGGRFSVVRRLAQGGMGEVLLAEFAGDAALGLSAGLVVIKRVLPDHPNRAHQASMLREEGRISLRLLHENLVETFFVDEDDGDPLIVMEFLSGRAMSQVLGQAKKRKESVPIDVTLALMRAAACGLHFAHTLQDRGRPLGLIHRDVSPANLFVTFDGRVKVIDFGVAKADDSEIRTSTGILKGKLGYMSPEHAIGDTLTPAADMWSLGVLFWETLCAERLFASSSPSQTLAAISEKPIPPPTKLRPDVPPQVVELCMGLLERSLDRRIATGAQLVARIDGLPDSALARVDLGGWLSARFPEEADRGQQEAAHCTRMQRRSPVAMGLVEGTAEPPPSDDDLPTLVINAQAIIQAVDQASAEDQRAAASSPDRDLVAPDQLPTRELNVGRPGLGSALFVDRIETSPSNRLRAASADRGGAKSPADALPPLQPLLPPPATPVGPAGRRSDGSRGGGTGLSAQALRSTTALASRPTSWLAVAGLTFGVLAIAMGVGFSFVTAKLEPSVVYAYDAPAGHEVLVAVSAHVPEGHRGRRVELAAPSVRFSSESAPRPHAPDELEPLLRRSGVWARAALPSTQRAQVALLLPLLIAALGLLALSIALPTVLLRRALPRNLLRAVLCAGWAVSVWFAIQAGGLGWPGLQAWSAKPELELVAAPR